MTGINFKIERHVATIGTNENGLTKQLNIISWNDKPPVFDLRTWSTQGKPYKGVTMAQSEIAALRTALLTETLSEHYGEND